MRRLRCQQLFFAINQICSVERRQLKSVPVCDRIRRTRLHAIPAKNAPVVIDVVDLGVALPAGYPQSLGVLGGLDVDAFFS